MDFPFKKILCPVDFDENALAVLEMAGRIARENGGKVFLIHALPLLTPAGRAVDQEFYQHEQDLVSEKLGGLAERHLKGTTYEIRTEIATAPAAILKAATDVGADLVVMATHGRHGLSRFLLGSVTEAVLREAPCPILVVRWTASEGNVVGKLMTTNPVTAGPDEKLSAVEARMREGNFRFVPVVERGKLVGVITDRDLKAHTGYLDHTEVRFAMSEAPLAVQPDTSLAEAARLILEKKFDGLPVVEHDRLVGVITTTDLVRALFAEA